MPLTIKRTNPVAAGNNNFQFARRTSTAVGNSVLFNGSNQYLSVPGSAAFAFGTGSFTTEWWQYMTSQPSNPRVFSIGNYPSATIGVSIEGGTFYVWENSGVRFSYSLTADGYLNRWLHFAISRNNGTTSIFKNGIQIGASYPDTNNINNTSTTLSIGQESTPTANSYFPGYISNFRILNGTALYTASFTAPNAPLTAIANTSLLTCNAATIVDGSTNNFTITNNNTATVSTTTPFTVASAASTMKMRKVYADVVTYMVATGGNSVITSGSYKIHTFTTVGTSSFVVSSAGNVPTISVLTVGGGAGGAGFRGGVSWGGGGGGGGVTEVSGLTVGSNTYSVIVGAGGVRGSYAADGGNGEQSSFGITLVTASGGFGGKSPPNGSNGGTSGNGFLGGTASGGGGGGGAAQTGSTAGPGGNGATSSLSGTVTYYGGGGGGGTGGSLGPGGLGGGGSNNGTAGGGTDGTPNTGGGGANTGGDPSGNQFGHAGGSGIVIIKYRYAT